MLLQTPQRLDVMMLKSEELFVCTGVNCAVFEIHHHHHHKFYFTTEGAASA